MATHAACDDVHKGDYDADSNCGNGGDRHDNGEDTGDQLNGDHDDDSSSGGAPIARGRAGMPSGGGAW